MSHNGNGDAGHEERPHQERTGPRERTGRDDGRSGRHPGGRTGGRADRRPEGRSGRTGRGRKKGGSAPPGAGGYRKALRRESPTLVGVILTDEDFTAMTRYASFPFRDYDRYLHHLDGMLRTLHAQGRHVAVTLFDPQEYADYCATTRRPPDTAATRTRYITEVTAGRTAVPYARQPMRALRAELAHAADRHATWEYATDVLMDAGPCGECGQELVHCAFDRASHTLLRLAEAVGPGTHHMVCSLPMDDGPPLLAAATIDADPGGGMHLDESEALVLCTVMAASRSTARAGGLVVRTTDADGTDTVRGWALRRGEPHPLTEAEVFDAYCTDALTGEPVPPEHGVRYGAGIPLPPPPPHEGPAW